VYASRAKRAILGRMKRPLKTPRSLVRWIFLRRRLVISRVPVELARGDPSILHSASRLTGDFFRATTLCMVAREINEKSLQGNVAELGVHRGEFASLINGCFPDRALYLLDTFEGFDRDEFDRDRREGLTSRWQPFATSIAEVEARMPHPDRVIVAKGRFPETAARIEGPFAFVSIDADLYAPTIAGLEYFCPRLVPGGYIFVHDFNQPEYRGSRKAVVEYCGRDPGMTCVPIGDWGGTAILKRHADIR
jgi:O-methyltransferase